MKELLALKECVSGADPRFLDKGFKFIKGGSIW